MERFITAPAVYLKVAIKSQDLAGVKFSGQMDQARVRKIHLTILIFPKNPLNLRCAPGELERNLKSSRHYILKNRFRRAGQEPKEIATLCDHGLASHQRSHGRVERCFAGFVMALAAIE
jgi:hypothetical protein